MTDKPLVADLIPDACRLPRKALAREIRPAPTGQTC